MLHDKRPLSPHLTIYKLPLAARISITHRITGMALYAGTALMLWWLWTIAYAPTQYPSFHEYVTSKPGLIILFCWTLAFYFHFANGIRHLFWDMGKGFLLPTTAKTNWLVIFFALAMNALTWNFIIGMGE